jgi:hypothetical protein
MTLCISTPTTSNRKASHSQLFRIRRKKCGVAIVVESSTQTIMIINNVVYPSNGKYVAIFLADSIS